MVSYFSINFMIIIKPMGFSYQNCVTTSDFYFNFCIYLFYTTKPSRTYYMRYQIAIYNYSMVATLFRPLYRFVLVWREVCWCVDLYGLWENTCCPHNASIIMLKYLSTAISTPCCSVFQSEIVCSAGPVLSSDFLLLCCFISWHVKCYVNIDIGFDFDNWLI